MASWIVHLRVAECVFEQIPQLDETLFAIGNIAPDSGLPDEKWEHFTPPQEVTHLKPPSGTSAYRAGDLPFFRRYLQPLREEAYDSQRFSFLLGYFFHLLTDNNWSRRISVPTRQRYAEGFRSDRSAMWEAVKKDWYGLDHVYVRAHPHSLFWRVFLNSRYDRSDLDFLPLEGIQRNIAYIQEFYQKDDAEIQAMIRGPFVYLTMEEVDRLVSETAKLCLAAYHSLWLEKRDSQGVMSALEWLEDPV